MNRPRLCFFLLATAFGLLLAAGARAQAPNDPANGATVTAGHVRAAEHGTMEQRGQSLLGLAVFTLVTFGIGQLRRPRLPVLWRTIFWGLALQFLFAVLVLNTQVGLWFFQLVNDGVVALLGFSEQGARFVFGDLAKQNVPVGQPAGDPLMGPVASPSAYAHTGAFFAFNVLPTIIFFSALSTLAYHSGIMQYVVGGIAWVMQRSMKTSGA